MGAGQSKERKLYEAVRRFDVNEIRSLHAQGASVNWISSSGKTPLILACSMAFLLPTAILLLEIGADVNYYDPRSYVGTALHRAVGRGLEQTAILLLTHGANPLLENCFNKNSLDVARIEGHTSIVRAIEDKICFFSGWVLLFADPSDAFLEVSSKLEQGKIWAVVLPGDDSLSRQQARLKIALYANRQSSRPLKVIDYTIFTLANAAFGSQNSKLVFSHRASGAQLKLISTDPDVSAQLRPLFCPAPALRTLNVPPFETERTVPSSTLRIRLPSFERGDIEKAIAASIQSAADEGIPLLEVGVERGEEENKAREDAGVEEGRALADASTSGGGLSCVVCADCPVECACVPCGHLATCKGCLEKVKRKGFGCPVCRAPIWQMLKIYTV